MGYGSAGSESRLVSACADGAAFCVQGSGSYGSRLRAGVR